MSNRDDMTMQVVVVSDLHTARHQASQERKIVRAQRDVERTTLTQRLIRNAHRAALVGKARRTALMAARGIRGAGAAVGRGAGALAARGAARVAAINPVSVLLTTLAVVGVAAGRIVSGKPFEGMGEELNAMLLGDMDEEARAKMATRDEMSGDQHLARIRAQSAQANSQLKTLYDDLYKLRKREEDGATLMRREFPVNGMLDMLILSAWEALKRGFSDSGGPANLEEVRRRYLAARNSTPNSGAR